jgi:hypothetical protein
MDMNAPLEVRAKFAFDRFRRSGADVGGFRACRARNMCLYMVKYHRNARRQHTQFARGQDLASASVTSAVAKNSRLKKLPLTTSIAEKRGAHARHRRPSHKHIANIDDDVHPSTYSGKIRALAAKT